MRLKLLSLSAAFMAALGPAQATKIVVPNDGITAAFKGLQAGDVVTGFGYSCRVGPSCPEFGSDDPLLFGPRALYRPIMGSEAGGDDIFKLDRPLQGTSNATNNFTVGFATDIFDVPADFGTLWLTIIPLDDTFAVERLVLVVRFAGQDFPRRIENTNISLLSEVPVPPAAAFMGLGLVFLRKQRLS